jgi:ssDNA-binding Zn-finger/Zn-ribbon topoisomerase 1
MAAGSAGGGAAAAAAVAAARRHRRFLFVQEILSMVEAISCPLCGKGKMLPLMTERSTNWVCSQPECAYMIHQHGSDNKRVWKGQANKEQPQQYDGWLQAP